MRFKILLTAVVGAALVAANIPFAVAENVSINSEEHYFSSESVWVPPEEEGDEFEYEELENGTLAITGYNGKSTNVVIPSEIDGKKVTRIYYFDFPDHGSFIESIKIPDSITEIDFKIFDVCHSLTAISVDDKNEIYSSRNGLLYDKSRSTLLICPEGIKGVVEIPDSVTEIATTAFSYNPSLTAIYVDDKNEVFSSYNGILYDKSMSVLKLCPQGMKGDIEIPNGVTEIGARAFSHCTSLTSIEIPNSVTEIGDQAFYTVPLSHQ